MVKGEWNTVLFGGIAKQVRNRSGIWETKTPQPSAHEAAPVVRAGPMPNGPQSQKGNEDQESGQSQGKPNPQMGAGMKCVHSSARRPPLGAGMKCAHISSQRTPIWFKFMR